MTERPEPRESAGLAVAWEAIKVFILVGGLLTALVYIGRWWGATDSALTVVTETNRRIEGKVDVLLEHDRDQEIRLRVLESRPPHRDMP